MTRVRAKIADQAEIEIYGGQKLGHIGALDGFCRSKNKCSCTSVRKNIAYTWYRVE